MLTASIKQYAPKNCLFDAVEALCGLNWQWLPPPAANKRIKNALSRATSLDGGLYDQ